jgi:hypothetical protein
MSPESPPPIVEPAAVEPMPTAPFLIVGVTGSGRAFRPSDWADRLAGVMAGFQPPGNGPGSHLHFSPYALPGVHGEHKCVRVDPAIAAIEPMALAFLLNFARDNDLQVVPISGVA